MISGSFDFESNMDLSLPGIKQMIFQVKQW